MSTTPIDAVGATTDLGNEGPGRAVENPGALLDRDAFLKLLVAQLKYQDPSKPADASQMLAQSAQLTMVDRLNELTTAYQESAASQRLSLAGTIVGRDVTFVDAEGTRLSATVETASIENDELTVVAGGYSVPFGAILSVHAPTIAAPTIPLGSTPLGSTPDSSLPGGVAPGGVVPDGVVPDDATADDVVPDDVIADDVIADDVT